MSARLKRPVSLAYVAKESVVTCQDPEKQSSYHPKTADMLRLSFTEGADALKFYGIFKE
jgi:hypothetical protein